MTAREQAFQEEEWEMAFYLFPLLQIYLFIFPYLYRWYVVQ